MKDLCVAIGFGVLLLSVGCTQQSLTAPTELVSNSTTREATSSTSPYQVVTLQADLTAAPASVTVKAWDAVTFVNRSGRFVTIHSYNCNEFSVLRIPDGYSRNTNYFRPAGKKCDYFAWDDNDYSRQVFVGDVNVQ